MFSRDSLLFLIIVGVLPNIVFLMASPFYLAERITSPLFYLLAAFAALFLPRWLAWCAFLLAATIDLGLVVMFAFHLPINVAIDSIRYTASIDIAASLFYLTIISLVAAATILTAMLTFRYKARLRAASPVPVTMMALALMAYDWNFTFPYFVSNQPSFDSAHNQTGLSAEAIARKKNNVLVVIVEGLGAFADPKERTLFEQALIRNLPEGRFKLETGITAYQGSTTGATSRELCGKWGDYLDYLGNGPQDCLPRQLAERGFETIAYHGFSWSMFDRDRWYPDIGFNELNFLDNLVAAHGGQLPGRCGSVFIGLCDPELGDIIHQRMVEDSANPKFVYWLTLNTHIPYRADPGKKFSCTEDSAKISNRTVCELSELWLQVFEKVNEIAADPQLPPTDILVVGDHHTPLWQRAAKNRFILDKVDWYLLRDNRHRAGSVVSASSEVSPSWLAFE